jgi:paraquat-inducible protein A
VEFEQPLRSVVLPKPDSFMMSTVSYPHMTICAGCDQTYVRRPLSSTESARCRRCGSTLEHGHHLSISTWLALTLTAAILMVFANVFPVAVISLGGLESEATLWQSVVALAVGPGAPVAVTAGMIVIGVPALQVLILLWILSFAVAGRSCPYFVPALRVLRASKPWGMIEVCLLAILVALVKLSGFLHVVAGVGIAAIVVLAPLMAVITNRSAGDLWALHEARNGLRFPAAPVGRPDQLMACDLCGLVHEGAVAKGGAAIACARCGSEVRSRKPDSIIRTWAFLLAALVLYIPANMLPVMYTRLFGSEAESTILEGVEEFWRSGSWDIAVLIFTASVAVPCTKFLAITLLLLDQKFPIGSRVGKTRLLKLVEHIGYWSMLDVLVVALVTALIQFRAVGIAEPRSGIVFFGAVVVLTMLAAMSFDPRLAWKRQVWRG